MTIRYTRRLGADILLALDATSGDPAAVGEAITAWMEQVVGGQARAEAAVEYVAASGDDPAYWNVTVAGAVTKDLPPGLYKMDARAVSGGSVVITRPVEIMLERSPSGELTP